MNIPEHGIVFSGDAMKLLGELGDDLVRQMFAAAAHIALGDGRWEVSEDDVRTGFIRVMNRNCKLNSLDEPLKDLFPVRVRNVCDILDIKTIRELSNCTEEFLLQQRNLGEGSVENIKRILGLYGLTLKGSVE